jgi:tetratricopeptide (TPR) repeat protein
MKNHKQHIASLLLVVWASLSHLCAQTISQADVQIQQAIGQKQYVQAMQLVNAVLAKLNPKQPAQRRQYGTYLALKAEISFRQKNYEEAVSQASEAGDVLKKYPSDVVSVKNQALLMYTGLLDDDEEGIKNNRKLETLFLSSLAEKNVPRLHDTYMAMGNESGKANAWNSAITFYSAATQLPGIQQDPMRRAASTSKMTAAMAQINQDDEEEAEEERKKQEADASKKKAPRRNNHE